MCLYLFHKFQMIFWKLSLLLVMITTTTNLILEVNARQ